MSTDLALARALIDAKAILDGQDVPTRKGRDVADLIETWKAQGVDVEAMRRALEPRRTYTLSLRGPFPGR